MANSKKLNKKGFGYIVAIGMLALLAFMGFFLMQSSATEYSQTSMSLYRTVGRQIAEAAADEAAVQVEQLFKQKTDLFDKLLLLASNSVSLQEEMTGVVNNSGYTSFAHDTLSDLTDYVTVTEKLDAMKSGFVIDKVLPSISEVRPISQGPLDDRKAFYRPKDRDEDHPFDVGASRDFCCTLQIDVTLSLRKQSKMKIQYRIARDIKLINIAPMARNYSYYSILGLNIKDYNNLDDTQNNDIYNALNGYDGYGEKEEGRLILWNVPFQSRVYLHGPAIINLENPNYGVNIAGYNGMSCYGGFANPAGSKGPGQSMAYQYDDTFYGFSYFPDGERCLFPGENFISGIYHVFKPNIVTKGDETSLADWYGGLWENGTADSGGQYPEQNVNILEGLTDQFTNGWKDTYLVGRNWNQHFLPAGPFCRTPWRYVATDASSSMKKSPFLPNRLDPEPLKFPEDDNKIRLEHRWVPDDDNVEKVTKILARGFGLQYRYVLNEINPLKHDSSGNNDYIEFSLSYYNKVPREGFWNKLFGVVDAVNKAWWNTLGLPSQIIGTELGGLIGNWIKKLKKKSANQDTAQINEVFTNFYPTNYKFNYQGIVTRHLKNIEELTDVDEQKGNALILNGVYLIDDLRIEGYGENGLTYIGTGTFIVCNPEKPPVIKCDVLAYRAAKDAPPQGHLNIIYHPNYPEFENDLATGNVKNKMLKIEGSGITVEASIYSRCGIKSEGDSANLTKNDLISMGMNPNLPMNDWFTNTSPINNAQDRINMILGNYINYYMLLNDQGDDLWVMHNHMNSLYFQNTPDSEDTLVSVQDILDWYPGEREKYERLTHEFYLSPKIQHVGIIGEL